MYSAWLAKKYGYELTCLISIFSENPESYMFHTPSIDKTKELLKWAPKYSNSDALIRSYKWYLEHKGEIVAGTGITHRIAWNQGILRFFKKFL